MNMIPHDGFSGHLLMSGADLCGVGGDCAETCLAECWRGRDYDR